MTIMIGTIGIIGTIIVYLLSNKIYKKWNSPFTLPILLATIFILIFLLIFQIPYETYMAGGKWLNELLGPAVVALAYPLYMNRHLLKKLILPIFLGSFIGALAGVSSGLFLAKVMNFNSEILLSISTKSVTTPVSMAITETIGGIVPLAVIFVMIAGISGTMLSEPIFKFFRIKTPLGRGMALGCASHAIGTAKALENSQLEGSISSVAMILSAVVVSVITPWLIALWI